MTKMLFAKPMKYNGKKYPPHTTVEVPDTDVSALQMIGGWTVEPTTKPTQPPIAAEPVVEDSAEPDTENPKPKGRQSRKTDKK